MSGPPLRSSEPGGTLQRCIRDLAALTALPSMCVGRSPEEVLEIVLDALPTALGCELIALSVPRAQSVLGTLDGARLSDAQLIELRAHVPDHGEHAGELELAGADELSFLTVQLPVGKEHGRLLAARRAPLSDETDRVLVRSAANLVGSTLEAARALDEAHRKDEFLAMLGHELRNPLAPILTAVELLARNSSAAREQQVIERHTRHLARLVDDLLDISRVTQGHVELRREAVALDSVLEQAVEIATPMLNRNSHRLHVDRADGVTIQGDPVRLAQIFANLLTNAAKFTPQRGNVELTITRSNGRVRVAVRDDGRGIAREQLTRIFEPFVQVDREADALRGGLGLGLAIVRNLVERHGGTIAVHSEGLGHGTTFTVELPAHTNVKPQIVVARAQAPAARAGVRVLVVDDDADIADLLSQALRFEGFETAIAHDAQAALDSFRTFSPHAAVLDVGLPYTDGYQLARSLRAEHGRKPTLIAATGYGQYQDRLRAADAGFDCHFVKPVSVRDLLQVLDRSVVGSA